MFFYVFQDERDEWRWRLYAANNKIIAVSGEGYVNKDHCIDMINKVATETGGIPIKFQ